MKTILFICCTPYQIMLSVLISMQCFSEEDVVDLLITDTFVNSKKIADKIRNIKLFHNVYTADSSQYITVKNIKQKIDKVFFSLFYRKKIEKIIGEDSKYDELFFNSEDLFLFNIVTVLKEKNSNCKISRYEEGYSSYTTTVSSSQKSKNFVERRNKILGKHIFMKWDYFYVFEPELLFHKPNCEIKVIDRNIVNLPEYKSAISNIFDASRVAESYNKKYIIFEESFVRDGYSIDDLEIFRKIIDFVGKDNVSIKLHPRTINDRFSKYGIDVHKSEGVPWEAILLSKNFKNVVLITLASGSVINSRLLLGEESMAFLLYKCLIHKPPILDSNFERFVENFSKKYSKGVHVPLSTGDAMNQLNSEKSRNDDGCDSIT